MKHFHKKLVAVLLLLFTLALPGMASATTYYNVKFTINGQTQNLRLPIDLESITKNSAKTFRFVYTYKDGKWVLTSKNQSPIVKQEPIQKPVTPTEKKSSDKKPKSTNVDVKGLTADEKQMLNLVNAERQKAGLLPLQNDMRLVDQSRKKSQDMIEKGYFSHTSPTYGTPFEALKNNGIPYRYAGENLAGASTVERAHSSLMNSPGHRANILNPNFTHIGIGIVDGGPYGKMYTQTFIGTK